MRPTITCRRLSSDKSGSIAVEAAFAITLLMLMLLPLLDFGGYIGTRLELKQALRAGGQYALEDYTDAATIGTIVKQATSLKPGSVAVAQDPSYCLCNDGTPGACINTPGFSVCADGVAAGRFLTLRASSTYDPYFPFLPWFTKNQTVTEQLTLRVQ